MASLSDDLDDEEFTGFNWEELALLRGASGKQDSSDDEDNMSNETCDEDQEVEDLVWEEGTDDVDVPEFTQAVGPTRTMPPNSTVLDCF